jgi:acetyltransferase-like isoleucine patch superfamily enzyme
VTRGAVYALLIRGAGGVCGRGLRVESGVRFRQRLHSGLRFGNDVYIGAGSVIDCSPCAVLEIGDNATLTHGVFISSLRRVSIGADALIGEYCSFRDANHSFSDRSKPINRQPMPAVGITVGENCWIGRGCAVLAGAEIGHGTIIGANSVVRGQTPPDMIFAGAPAKKIRDRFENG